MNKRIAGRLAGALGLLLALSLLFGMGVTPALALPQMPHQFWGTVTIGGSAAPAGTSVSAKIGGTTYATTTTDSLGRYGYASAFMVPGDDPDTSGIIEGGTAGQTVQFYVGTTLATETATFQYGGITQRNLTIASPLTVTINQAAGQADPTSASPINFTVVFNATVTDFATGDVTLGGTAGATTATVTGSGATYNVAVTGMTSSGTVIATILAGVAHDALSNPNNASTSTDNQVTYNVPVGPTVTINQAAGQADPTSSSPINFTAVFSAAVTDFATGDVTLGGTAGATTATVTGSGATYNVAVTGMTSSGTVIATILAGVAHDALSNPNAASTSTDNTVTYNAPAGGGKLIGADDVAGCFRNSLDFLFLDKWTAVATGNIEVMKIKCFDAGNVKVAIYADNNGTPGALLNAVNTSTPVGAGWNDIPFPSTPVTQGTVYWLASKSNVNSIHCVQQNGSVQRYGYDPYANAFPATPNVPHTFQGYNLVAGWSVAQNPPGTPTMTTPGTTIRFGWDAVNGATKYQLQVSTNTNFTTTVYDAEVTGTSQDVTGLTVGTTYYARVRAGNNAGWSAYCTTRSMLVQ